MNYTANNAYFWRTIIKSAALAWLLSAMAASTLAQPNAVRPPTGVRNSHGPKRLSETQLQTLQQSLRHKSGLVELGFDAQGALTLGDRTNIVGGSATARALLAAAVDSPNLYELESHEESPDVAFARILETADKLVGESGRRMTLFQVQLDFYDFSLLGGAREAKASFEVGFALLHELVHGVLKLQDPQGEPGQLGECDAHVNQMRRELQLPERLYYQPDIVVLKTADGRHHVFASIKFVRPNALANGKYQLTWQATQVSPHARNIAQLQQGLVMAKRN